MRDAIGEIVTGWGRLVVGGAAVLLCSIAATAAAAPGANPKLDRALNDRADKASATLSRVIVILKPGTDATD